MKDKNIDYDNKEKDIDYDNLVKEVIDKRIGQMEEFEKKEISNNKKELQNLNVSFNYHKGMFNIFSVCNTNIFLP